MKTIDAPDTAAGRYYGLLVGLLKSLTRNQSNQMDYTEEESRVAKITLAEWTRGIPPTIEGKKIAEEAERLIQLNGIAGSLRELWAWRDDPNT